VEDDAVKPVFVTIKIGLMATENQCERAVRLVETLNDLEEQKNSQQKTEEQHYEHTKKTLDWVAERIGPVVEQPTALSIAEGVVAALSYPRGSEAQIRCLEETGQDAKAFIARSVR
jgi:hypothetical protein